MALAYYICVLLLVYISQCYSKNHTFKYHQEHVEVRYTNKNYIKYLNFKNTKVNRTTRTYSGEVQTLADLTTKAWYKVEVYQFRDNRFQLYPPLNFAFSVCTVLAQAHYGVKKAFEKYTNFPVKCPIKKGTYYFKNWVAQDTYELGYGITGSFKCVFTVFNDNDKVLVFEDFVSVERIYKY